MKGLTLAWLFGFLLVIATNLGAQIINIENKRIRNDSIGWSGDFYFNLAGQRNQDNLFSINGGTNLYYKGLIHGWLLLNEYNLVRAGQTNLSNQLFSHLRYSYKLSEHIKLESFIQIQRNVLIKLRSRSLAGTGARIKLTDHDNAKFYWGALYMLEFEETLEPEISVVDHRLSSYFSFSLFPQDDISFISTTYMQPRLDLWSDYRLNTENQLNLAVTRKFGIRIQLSFRYDTAPPEAVPGLTYDILNGLTYRFN